MEQHAVILDPSAPARPPEDLNARTITDLRGKVVAFIDNTKPNFDLLADEASKIDRLVVIVIGKGRHSGLL